MSKKAPNRIEYRVGDQIGECFFIRDTKTVKKKRYALFRCKCGREFEQSVDVIRRSVTKSCGCRQSNSGEKNSRRSHGFSNKNSPYNDTYRTWAKIKERCYNKNCWGYQYYGAKGVKMCDRWLGENGAKNFVQDMGVRPSGKHSIDRFPNKSGDYEPGNCRWATQTEQARNKDNNALVTFRGESLTCGEWSERTGIKWSTIWKRISEGWPVHFALTTKTNPKPASISKIIENSKKISYSFGHIK